MATTTNLTTLKINYLTQAQYDAALANDEINDDEIYLTPESSTNGHILYGTSAPTADVGEDGDIYCVYS